MSSSDGCRSIWGLGSGGGSRARRHGQAQRTEWSTGRSVGTEIIRLWWGLPSWAPRRRALTRSYPNRKPDPHPPLPPRAPSVPARPPPVPPPLLPRRGRIGAMPGGGAALRRALLGAGRRGAGGGSRAAMVSREGKRGLRCGTGGGGWGWGWGGGRGRLACAGSHW